MLSSPLPGLTLIRWYSVWNMGGDKEKKFDLFADTSSESHAANKRLVSNSFSAKSLHELEDLVDKTVYKLLRCMDDMTVRGEIINLSDWLQWFAFDVIGHVTFSEDFGFLEKGADIDGTLRSILEMSRAGIVVAEMPELAKYRHTSLFQKLPIVGVYRGKLNFLAMVSGSPLSIGLDNKLMTSVVLRKLELSFRCAYKAKKSIGGTCSQDTSTWRKSIRSVLTKRTYRSCRR